MARRLSTLASACIAVAIALTACDSGAPPPPSAHLRGTPVAVRSLTDRLANGLAATITVHVDLAVEAQDMRTRIAADERLHNGRSTALQVDSDSLGLGGPVRIVAAGGHVYAHGPETVNPTDKPWVLVTAHSRSDELRRIAQAVDIATASVSPDQVTALAHAATAATRVGPTRINGTSTTHYEMSVDTTNLPADFPGKKVLDVLGLDAVPVDLYLDGAGRPVRATLHVSVVGQHVTLRIDTSGYGRPVAIVAPSADEVGHA